MNTVGNDIAVSGDARVAVIGVGGAGCKIASMLYGKMCNVGVIAINTDRKSLENTPADLRLYICKEVTKGLGTNGDPALGKKCAQIHEDEISAAVSKYQSAIIVAGLGGGTGTGAASVVAELCDRAGLSVGAITIMPFSFESDRTIKAADGYRALHAICKEIVKCENDKALGITGVKTIAEAMDLLNQSVVVSIENAIHDAKREIGTSLAKKVGTYENEVSAVDAVTVAKTDIEESH